MYRTVLLAALAAFAIAQAAPGSRFTPTRDALDDAFQNAEKYYEEQRTTFNELFTETNKSASVYLTKALDYSAKYAEMLHSRVDEAVEHYNVTGSDSVVQCRSQENEIEAIYVEYLNEIYEALKKVSTEQVRVFEFFLTLIQDLTEDRRKSAQLCDSHASEAATSKCRNDILIEFSGELNSLKEPMANFKFTSEMVIYSLNTYYPISELVLVTKYNDRAHSVAVFTIKCISELQ